MTRSVGTVAMVVAMVAALIAAGARQEGKTAAVEARRVTVNSHEAINPARRAKKATGLKGRQWVKYRKAAQRAKRAVVAERLAA